MINSSGAVGGMRIGNVILSTTSPTWSDLGWNPDRRYGKPATDHLSYGTVRKLVAS
jgi:hypothetical protein